MYKNKTFLIVFSLAITQFTIGQNNTNSPYTRFGYGNISDNNSGGQRAMGGVSIGSRSNQDINNVNPASYSAVDSLTFMFDLGSSALVSRFSDNTGKKTTMNANLEYLAMQFRIKKWLGFSAGLLPYSFLGYNYYSKDSVTLVNNTSTPTKIGYTSTFNGSGGFSQVYTGLSTNLFNHLSLGANAYYMFGTMNNYRYVAFDNNSLSNPSSRNTSVAAGSLRFRYGVQLYNTFAKKHDVTLGFIYEQKTKLNSSFSEITTGGLNDTISTEYQFETPTLLGAGLQYTYDKKLTIGVDYSLQKWGEAKFFWDPATSANQENLRNRSKIALGFEYIPNPVGRNLSDKIKYRAGVNMSDAYYQVDGLTPQKNYGVSLGLGLPLYNKATNSISMLNATVEYGKIGSVSKLREDYLKFTLNVIFNEHWFFKRKL
ncbi:MAG TPA: hypothetical protein VK152_00160 [Paludibacter sp.]|nr:hypothetical protein [Paludibacter sp.]